MNDSLKLLFQLDGFDFFFTFLMQLLNVGVMDAICKIDQQAQSWKFPLKWKTRQKMKWHSFDDWFRNRHNLNCYLYMYFFLVFSSVHTLNRKKTSQILFSILQRIDCWFTHFWNWSCQMFNWFNFSRLQ